MLKTHEKILFFLYEGLILETTTSEFFATLTLIIPNLQYLSFQFDNYIWPEVKYLNQQFIELIIRFCGLPRISILFRLSGLGVSWEALPFFLVFISTLATFLLFIFYFFQIKRCYKKNQSLGYDFEFMEMANYEDMRQTFVKKENIVGTGHIKMEEKGKAIFFKTHHNMKIYILKNYNSVLPILILPFMEIYMENVGRLIKGNVNVYFLIDGVFSIFGVLIFSLQIFLNTFLFNNFAFDSTKNLNRNVRFSDVLWPFINVIGPIIAHCLKNIDLFYYFNAIVQFLIVAYLLMVYSTHNTYFNPKINEIYGMCLIFRLIIPLIFFICTNLEDFPCFLILLLSLAIKFSMNLSKLIRNKITNNINLKSIYFQQNEEDEINQKKSNYNFTISNRFYIAFFSNFYYLKESVKPTFFQILEEIPLNFIGYFREHLNQCTKENCPLLKKPMQPLNSSKSFLKKLSIEFDWGNKPNIKSNIAKYISEIYRQEASIMTLAQNETRFLYIIFLLYDHKGIIRSILTLNSLFLRNLAFHERFILHELREFMCKYMRMIEEKTLFKSKEIDSMSKKKNHNKSLKKEDTRFDSSLFVDLEKIFNLLKNNIEFYKITLKNLLKELTLEKVSLAALESGGKSLLYKFDEIRSSFLRGNKNVRFIKIYRDFITIFKEDEWELRRELTKLFHLINQVEENYEQAGNNQGAGFSFTDEMHFFNEKSCFLYVSGLEKNIGRIIKSDENMSKLFGYSNPNAMVGISIDDLMPKIFGRKHNSIMMNYLETGLSNFIYRQNKLFGINKAGFTFPLNITVKPYLNRSNFSLEFLAHIKPTNNKKENLIIVDDLGNIDCYGEALEEIFNKFYEKNRGQNLPIQILIPDLLDYFQTTSETFIRENKEILEKKKSERSLKHKYGSTGQSFRTFKTVMSYKKKFLKNDFTKTIRKTNIDIETLFNNFLKNEFGDFIVQIIVKDNYPTFPDALNMEVLEEVEILNYLNHIKSLVHTNESPCDVYRIEISIESRTFSDMTINILHVRRFKHLYRNNCNNSIEKVLTKLKKNTFTLFPKILRQTAFLRVCHKKANFAHKNNIGCKSEEEIKIEPSKSQSDKNLRRVNSDITSCPQLYLEEVNNDCNEEELKPDIDRNLFIEELKREKYLGQKKNSFQESPDQEFEKLKSVWENSPLNEFLKPPLSSNNAQVSNSSSNFDKKLLNIFSRSISSNSMCIKREEQKYFADEGRHLYKIQSKENSLANFSKSYQNENEKCGPLSKASSLLSNALDTKKEFRRLMDQKYLPPSYTNIMMFSLVAILLAAASFFSYGGLSNQMLSELSDDVFTTDLVENYKICILKLLVIEQNRVAFFNNQNINEMNSTYYTLRSLDYRLKIDPLKGFSENVMRIEISNGSFQILSVIMGMDLYFEAIEAILHDEKNSESFVINNGINLFNSMNTMFTFEEKIKETLDRIKTNLIILVFLSLGLMSFLMFSILANMYFSHKFINSTLKLLCSISIKDYKSLYSDLFEAHLDNNDKIQFKSKDSLFRSSITKENLMKDKGLNQSSKKKIRQHVLSLKFSKLNFLFLFVFFVLYSSLFIVNLNQSELLDTSLANKLLRKNLFNDLRLNFYHLLSLLNDQDLGYVKTLNGAILIQQQIKTLGTNLEKVLNMESFADDEKTDFDKAINENLCENKILKDVFDLFEKCPKMGSGALSKGLYSGMMYLYTSLKAIVDGRISLVNSEINEELLNILRIFDFSGKKYFSDSIERVAYQLKNQSIVLMVMNCFMACGISFILFLFIRLVVKSYEKRLILVKKMLGLIPFNIISKSQKIRKYLNSTKKSKKI